MHGLWNEATMGTGFEVVDQQHRELILKFSEFLEAMDEGRDADEIGELMDFLTVYVTDHFAYEESVMDKHACPARAVNAKAHQRFRMEFAELAEEFDANGPSPELADKARTKLFEWMIGHIQACDSQLRKCSGVCAK